MGTNNKYRIAFVALTSLFFVWGFITVVVDAFIPRLREVFELSYAKAGFVQIAWFLAYFLISIPGSIIVAKVGYKKGIIGGLLIAGIGCLLFVLAASTRMYLFFLFALFVLASGITILQVAANPYVSVLGKESGAASRLNLAQAFNSLGTTIAPIFSATFFLSDSIKTSKEIECLSIAVKETYYATEAGAVQKPFVFITLFFALLALIFLTIKLPRILGSHVSYNFMKPFKYKNLRLGAIGIFLYVGAEVAIGSYLVNYFIHMNMAEAIINNPFTKALAGFIAEVFVGKDLNAIDVKAIVGTFVIFYWGGAMIGRFAGSFLTRIMKPSRVLMFFSFAAILLLFITVSTNGFVAMSTALAVGFFNSIMFPTIFTISIRGLGQNIPQASGILCTAIVGGAVIPPLFGLIVDMSSFKIAFLLPIACYIYIIYFSRRMLNFQLS